MTFPSGVTVMCKSRKYVVLFSPPLFGAYFELGKARPALSLAGSLAGSLAVHLAVHLAVSRVRCLAPAPSRSPAFPRAPSLLALPRSLALGMQPTRPSTCPSCPRAFLLSRQWPPFTRAALPTFYFILPHTFLHRRARVVSPW